MNTTDANPAAPKWVLFLFPGNRLGQICCTFPGASPIKEFVPGRWARMLLMLQRAYIEDKDLPADVRGYRGVRLLYPLEIRYVGVPLEIDV